MNWKSEAELLLLLVLLLSIIALGVVKIHNIVRFESGLEDTNVLRGMWSKMPQVLFQPVRWPLAMGVYLGLGFRYTLEIFFETLLQIADVGGAPSTLAISLVCMALATFSAILVYRVVGGGHPERCLAGILGSSLMLYGLRLWSQPVGGFSPLATVLWVLGICLVTVASGLSASNWSLDFFAAQLQPQAHAAIPALWWGWGVPLVLLAACDELIQIKLDQGHYLQGVCLTFGDMMLLVSCAFIATWCTNRSVMAGDYGWKWQAVLIAGVPAWLFEVSALLFNWAVRHEPFAATLERKFILSVVSGSSGLIGSIIYLGVVAKYASAALDPGYEGQSELLDDDEEYEV